MAPAPFSEGCAEGGAPKAPALLASSSMAAAAAWLPLLSCGGGCGATAAAAAAAEEELLSAAPDSPTNRKKGKKRLFFATLCGKGGYGRFTEGDKGKGEMRRRLLKGFCLLLLLLLRSIGVCSSGFVTCDMNVKRPLSDGEVMGHQKSQKYSFFSLKLFCPGVLRLLTPSTPLLLKSKEKIPITTPSSSHIISSPFQISPPFVLLLFFFSIWETAVWSLSTPFSTPFQRTISSRDTKSAPLRGRWKQGAKN